MSEADPNDLISNEETPAEQLSDAQAAEEQALSDATPEDFEFPLPPPSFTFIVLSLRAQTEMQLGLMHFGQEKKPEPDLRMARHTIDLMSILLDKTKGNLDMDERRLLENSLTELRFRFVQVSDEVGKSATQKA